jgi:hypothetical protein
MNLGWLCARCRAFFSRTQLQKLGIVSVLDLRECGRACRDAANRKHCVRDLVALPVTAPTAVVGSLPRGVLLTYSHALAGACIVATC